MAANKPSSVRFQQARIVLDPTNTGAAYPHGGTEIGLFAEVRWYPGWVSPSISAEEYGGAVAKRFPRAINPRLVCLARGWDVELMQRLTGGSVASGRAKVAGDGSAGSPTTNYKVLCVGSGTGDIAVYIPVAEVLWDETVEVHYRMDREFTHAIVFGAVEGKFQVAELQDIVL